MEIKKSFQAITREGMNSSVIQKAWGGESFSAQLNKHYKNKGEFPKELYNVILSITGAEVATKGLTPTEAKAIKGKEIRRMIWGIPVFFLGLFATTAIVVALFLTIGLENGDWRGFGISCTLVASLYSWVSIKLFKNPYINYNLSRFKREARDADKIMEKYKEVEELAPYVK